MSDVFGSTYAESYDTLYGDKDYRAECELIERILRTFGEGSVRSILDLGCGTGNHAIPLAQRGYEVTGVDRSRDMLAAARRKAGDLRLPLLPGDVRTVDAGRTFDAVLMMFAVLGYQTKDSDVRDALRTVRNHLRPGGLFLFDVWYAPAVLRERPTRRVKQIPTPTGRIERVATGELNPDQHLCTVHYELTAWEKDRKISETRESHVMRYFDAPELEKFLTEARLSLRKWGAFPGFDRNPDDSTWNVMGVAMAV